MLLVNNNDHTYILTSEELLHLLNNVLLGNCVSRYRLLDPYVITILSYFAHACIE